MNKFSWIRRASLLLENISSNTMSLFEVIFQAVSLNDEIIKRASLYSLFYVHIKHHPSSLVLMTAVLLKKLKMFQVF